MSAINAYDNILCILSLQTGTILCIIMISNTDIKRSTFQEGTTDPSDQEKEPAIELSQLELGGNKLEAREISYLGDFITEYPPLVSIVSKMPGMKPGPTL